MNRIWKSIVLLGIVEDYAKRHGIQKIDWNISYFAQNMTIVSCIGDIARICGLRGNSKGWSASQTLYERCKRTAHSLPY